MAPDKDKALLVSPAAAGQRLDVFLAAASPGMSRAFLQRVIRAGGVRLDGGVCRIPKTAVTPGMTVAVTVAGMAPVDGETPPAEALPLSVLHEDADLLVVDKPAGMVVHPAAGVRTGTLVNALLGRYPGFAERFPDSPLRPGIVHRLDRDTSGCLVVALNKASQLALAKAFARREASKVYLAMVQGTPREKAGEICTAIGRHPVMRQKMAVRERGGRSAVTRYRVLGQGEIDGVPVSLLEATILTGRTHQIRVHLASLRLPVLGDVTYGGKQTLRVPRQLLHAWRLGLRHPATGEPVQWESPLPDDFRAVMARWGVPSPVVPG